MEDGAGAKEAVGENGRARAAGASARRRAAVCILMVEIGYEDRDGKDSQNGKMILEVLDGGRKDGLEEGTETFYGRSSSR